MVVRIASEIGVEVMEVPACRPHDQNPLLGHKTSKNP
jgi:hypothetical protein